MSGNTRHLGQRARRCRPLTGDHRDHRQAGRCSGLEDRPGRCHARTMQQGPASNRRTAGVGADEIALGLRRDARLAKSFIAHQRRRSMPGDPAIAAAEDYRRWCESSWEAFVYRQPDATFDLEAFAQQWRLMAYASDLRDPAHRLRRRERLTLVVMGVAAVAILISPLVGVAAGLVCGASTAYLTWRRNPDSAEDLVVGPDASLKAQRRASWHWNNSEFR